MSHMDKSKNILGVPIWQWGVVVLVVTAILGFGNTQQASSDKVVVSGTGKPDDFAEAGIHVSAQR